jgi:hypothetical protein
LTTENNIDSEKFQKKQDKDEPFVHRFFWLKIPEGKHQFPDLLELNALKLSNQAHCHLVEIDEVEHGKGHEYYIVAQGKKQKLMLLMELTKAWFLGLEYARERRKRTLNK